MYAASSQQTSFGRRGGLCRTRAFRDAGTSETHEISLSLVVVWCGVVRYGVLLSVPAA